MTTRSYASLILAFGGLILMGLGLYFVVLRPPLLPEDLRFIGASLEEIRAAFPGLLLWLRRVFWVMGGFMFTTGLFTLFTALTAFKNRKPAAALVVAAAGITSIGWMAVVNFLIQSDFRWLILSFTLPWFISLGLFWKERSNQ